MNKKQLLENIIKQLELDRKVLMDAALATYQAATNEESKPENEYDTRGLEASYLAGAQAKRVADLDEQISIFKKLEIKEFSNQSSVAATALIEVDIEGEHKFLFMLPKGGGFVMQFEGKSIQIVTPSSPSGEALLGLKVGDIAIVETANKTKEYEIISVS